MLLCSVEMTWFSQQISFVLSLIMHCFNWWTSKPWLYICSCYESLTIHIISVSFQDWNFEDAFYTFIFCLLLDVFCRFPISISCESFDSFSVVKYWLFGWWYFRSSSLRIASAIWLTGRVHWRLSISNNFLWCWLLYSFLLDNWEVKRFGKCFNVPSQCKVTLVSQIKWKTLDF